MVAVVEAIITLLCGVGLYATLFMLAKTRRAQRGELTEPSVVQSPRARLYGGVPNALIGAIYYPAIAASVWLVRSPVGFGIVAAAVAFAGMTSIVLAYSLLFVTRRPCPYCWTAHSINWALVVLVAWLFKMNILSSIHRF
jgi:uncharacterized membrane protein